MLRPLNQMRLGQRVGAAAAELARSSSIAGKPQVRGDSAEGSAAAGEVRGCVTRVGELHVLSLALRACRIGHDLGEEEARYRQGFRSDI